MLDSSRQALVQAAEVIPVAESEDDTVQRLRRKNRQLQEELTRMVALREEVYGKKVSDAERRYEQLLRERDENQARWYNKQELHLHEMWAAAKIMHEYRTRNTRQVRSMAKTEKQEYERKLDNAKAHTEKLESDHHQEKQRLQSELRDRSAQYEARIDELTKQKAEEEERSRGLERQLTAKRREIEGLTETEARQQQKIQQLEQQLHQASAEARRLEEVLRRDTRVKAMQREKDMLELEVQQYVKFIVDDSKAPAPEPPFGNKGSPFPGSPGATSARPWTAWNLRPGAMPDPHSALRSAPGTLCGASWQEPLASARAHPFDLNPSPSPSRPLPVLAAGQGGGGKGILGPPGQLRGRPRGGWSP